MKFAEIWSYVILNWLQIRRFTDICGLGLKDALRVAK